MEVSNKHGGYVFPHPSGMRCSPRRVDLPVRMVDDDDRFGIKEVKRREYKQDESELMILGMKSPRSMGWGSVMLEGGRRRRNEQGKSHNDPDDKPDYGSNSLQQLPAERR